MARRIRIPIKVTVKYRAQVRYRQQTTFRPVPVPLPARRPQLLTSSHRLTTRSPIREIRDNAIEYADAVGLPEAEHDLFIIHASEDQADLVAPLAQLLTDADLSVWYSGFVMKPGMSLRRSIDAGIANCEWGVVVLSPHFFDKPWPNHELNGLVARAMHEDKQMILPIWHGVGQAEVMRYSPSLADLFALSTAKDSVEDIARQIIESVRDD